MTGSAAVNMVLSRRAALLTLAAGHEMDVYDGVIPACPNMAPFRRATELFFLPRYESNFPSKERFYFPFRSSLPRTPAPAIHPSNTVAMKYGTGSPLGPHPDGAGDLSETDSRYGQAGNGDGGQEPRVWVCAVPLPQGCRARC